MASTRLRASAVKISFSVIWCRDEITPIENVKFFSNKLFSRRQCGNVTNCLEASIVKICFQLKTLKDNNTVWERMWFKLAYRLIQYVVRPFVKASGLALVEENRVVEWTYMKIFTIVNCTLNAKRTGCTHNCSGSKKLQYQVRLIVLSK